MLTLLVISLQFENDLAIFLWFHCCEDTVPPPPSRHFTVVQWRSRNASFTSQIYCWSSRKIEGGAVGCGCIRCVCRRLNIKIDIDSQNSQLPFFIVRSIARLRSLPRTTYFNDLLAKQALFERKFVQVSAYFSSPFPLCFLTCVTLFLSTSSLSTNHLHK